MLLAFYYPWYANLDVSGYWKHWNAAWHDPHFFVNDKRDIASVDYPVLGPYDSKNPEVIRQHIRWAKLAGIDGFIVSWWGDGKFTDEALDIILRVAEEENFKITLYWEVIEPSLESNISRINEVSTSPAWIWMEDQPVVFVYRRIMDEVDWLKVSGRENLFIVGDGRMVNGIHYYSALTAIRESPTYPEDGLTVGTLTHGFDNTAVREPGRVEPRSVENLELTNRKADEAGVDWKAVVTWNEWHESTEFEPMEPFRKPREHRGLFWLEKLREITQVRPMVRSAAIGLGILATGAVVTKALEWW